MLFPNVAKKGGNDKEVIYGKNACFGCMAGRNREIFSICILQSKFDEYYKGVPNDLRHLVKKCNAHDMFVLTHEQDKHQGIAMGVSRYRFCAVEDLVEQSEKSAIFLLDRVQDPHNVGNIIRTAFCFDVSAIILPERDACGITSAVVRTSAGYSEQMKICQVNNVGQALEKLKKSGYWVIGFDVNTNTKDTLSEVVGKYDKCVFVFGSEGEGMRELTKKSCDVLLRLPMRAGAESLNVANTAAIVGWEWFGKNK